MWWKKIADVAYEEWTRLFIRRERNWCGRYLIDDSPSLV